MDDTKKVELKNINLIIDQINLFLNSLRINGYKIGVETGIRIHVLLIRLSENGKLPDNTKSLCCFLSAIICKSKNDQQDFEKRFNQWINSFDTFVVTKSQIDIKSELQSLTNIFKKIWFQYSIFIIIIILVSSSVVCFFVIKQNIVPCDVIEKKQKQSIPQIVSEIEVKKYHDSKFIDRLNEISKRIPLLYLLIFGISLFLIIIWIMWKRWFTQKHIKRYYTSYSSEDTLFENTKMLNTARKLGHHVLHKTSRLDTHSTIIKSCEMGGIFSPVYKWQNISPEYLVLIDRKIYNDLQAHWIDIFLDRLEDNDIYIERFYFNGTPHILYSKHSASQPLPIDILKSQFSSHRLILFTDAELFVNPISGTIATWVKTLHFWPIRAVLMPCSEMEVSFRKKALIQSNFFVMPANEKGISILVEKFYQIKISEYNDIENDHTYPTILYGMTGRLLDKYPPPDEIIEDLLKELNIYLGVSCMEWLAACAIFPEINVNLTMFLGEKLEVINEVNILKLSRLPWFRLNSMPNWFRLRLINVLPEKQKQILRDAIKEQILRNNNPVIQSNYFNKRNNSKRKKSIPIFFRNKLVFNKLWIRFLLKSTLRYSDQYSYFKDNIFLQFMHYKLSNFISNQAHQKLEQTKSNKHFDIFKIAFLALLLIISIFSIQQFFSDFKSEIYQPSIHEMTKNIESIENHKLERFTNKFGMTFVRIPAGTFLMHKTNEKLYIKDNNIILKTFDPKTSMQYKTYLTSDYYMQTTEVTQGQWKAIMGENSSFFKNCGDNCPVENVSLIDIKVFIDHLNQNNNRIYRLPTEIEWEYAARAGGTDTLYNYNNQDSNCKNDLNMNQIGWFCWNSCAKYNGGIHCSHCKGCKKWGTQPVANKLPNKFSLYDMYGNVFEWCSIKNADIDISKQIKNNKENNGYFTHIIRGGGWNSSSKISKAGAFFLEDNSSISNNIGFRLVTD
jgi:formylglycine-generating enzyme required for sulfatase activity